MFVCVLMPPDLALHALCELYVDPEGVVHNVGILFAVRGTRRVPLPVEFEDVLGAGDVIKDKKFSLPPFNSLIWF